jgi:hypothetical protein
LFARRNNPGDMQERGAVESHRRHLKTAIDAALVLCGSRNFGDRGARPPGGRVRRRSGRRTK